MIRSVEKSPSKKADAGLDVSPRFRIYKRKDIVFGPGKAELLEHIAETGSISEAARRMKMSYNRAWLHVKVMNENFRKSLVASSRGGEEGGGASLTETGKRTLKLYRSLERETESCTSATRKKLLRLL